ncbi:MAG: phosphatase PAP2 family protein [Saprospiraceae bacterium]|nr:phosphatase PAP2 family protein [Saprospiraceae bacterium]
MIDSLVNWDTEAILWIHRNLHSALGNVIIPWLRKPTFWIPLYLVIIYVFIRKWRRRAWIVICYLLACVGISDLVSVHLFKNIFMRLRPCHTLMDKPDFELLVNCGGQYGFVSSHAVNHMAMAVFLYILFKFNKMKLNFLWILWALVIGFAQIYVGVHYPLDVICGFVVGGLIGWMCTLILRSTFPEFFREKIRA